MRQFLPHFPALLSANSEAVWTVWFELARPVTKAFFGLLSGAAACSELPVFALGCLPPRKGNTSS